MNTNMTGFRWFFKNLCVPVLWMDVATALEGLVNGILRTSKKSLCGALTRMLLANLANTKLCKKPEK